MANEQDDELVAFCTSCRNTTGNARAAKDPFLAAGKSGVCRYCGGRTIPMMSSEVEHYRQRPVGHNFL